MVKRAMPTNTIFTLNARGNLFLTLCRDEFGVKPDRMFEQIQGAFAETVAILARKNINYKNLKSALVPSTSRREIALVFDSGCVDGTWYGRRIFERILPLLSKESNHCILAGDYVGPHEHRRSLYDVFAESVQPVRNIKFGHPEQFFIVYINNLSDGMFDRLSRDLEPYDAFVGYADATHACAFSIFLSTMLPQVCLKHRDVVIMGHEDDRSNNEDVNMTGFPFEENGFTIRSLRSIDHGLFLEYKIQRPVFEGFDDRDSEFSINAIHPRPLPLDQMSIRVDQKKHHYLTTQKADSLKRIGLLDKDAEALKSMIADRIHSNYIYNMTYDKAHNTSRFDIIFDVPSGSSANPVRLLVALEYMPDTNELRVITLY